MLDQLLPPQRDLAAALGINLSTVTKAYQLAANLGLVGAEKGRGTFVRFGRSRIPWPSGDNLPNIDLASNFPIPLDPLNSLTRICQDMTHIDVSSRLFEYAPRRAWAQDAEAAAIWLAGLGLKTGPRNILITSGAINGVFSCLLAFSKRGESVLCEELTSPGLISCAKMLGVKLIGVPMDGKGIRPEAFERIARRSGARLAVLNPTLQNPTLTDLSVDRRERIAKFASKAGIILVEDEVYAPLLETPPPPLAAFAPDTVCYVTSFSKAVLPGLRIGYMAVPTRLAERLLNAIHVSTWMPSPMLARLASHWVTSGLAQSLCEERRAAAKERVMLARRIFPTAVLGSRDEGLHVWLNLTEPWRAYEFSAHTSKLGVDVLPSSDLVAHSSGTIQGIRLSLGAELDQRRLESGLKRVHEILQGRS